MAFIFKIHPHSTPTFTLFSSPHSKFTLLPPSYSRSSFFSTFTLKIEHFFQLHSPYLFFSYLHIYNPTFFLPTYFRLALYLPPYSSSVPSSILILYILKKTKTKTQYYIIFCFLVANYNSKIPTQHSHLSNFTCNLYNKISWMFIIDKLLTSFSIFFLFGFFIVCNRIYIIDCAIIFSLVFFILIFHDSRRQCFLLPTKNQCFLVSNISFNFLLFHFFCPFGMFFLKGLCFSNIKYNNFLRLLFNL